MQLPVSLQTAIDEAVAKVSISSLRAVYSQLSDAYRRGDESGEIFHNPTGILAYLLARMPATYAASCKVLQSLKERLPNWHCRTLLDLGAGPGTAAWAASEIFPSLQRIDFVEKNPQIIAIGRELASFSEPLKKGIWHQQDITQSFDIPQADLTVLSYVLAENNNWELIERVWARGTVLALIEPGTPKGFERIVTIRKRLIELGAFIVAPCPHQQKCPMSTWCHFPARVERTKMHKIIKEGSLGYEDEKFSYLIAAPFSPLPIEGRIVDNPLKLSGHVKFTLCTKDGTLEQKIVTRKQKDLYRQARDAEWSSAWM